jgi:hypothetical protein
MNGYIQLKMLGRLRGLKFGMIACQQIHQESQKLGKTLGASLDLALVPVIVYWGLWNNCYIKREDPDFTFEDVCNYVDEQIENIEQFTAVVECFYTSRIVQGATEKVSQEKKSTTLKQRKVGKS